MVVIWLKMPCFKRPLRHKSTADLKWNTYMQSDAEQIVDSSIRSRKYLAPLQMSYLTKKKYEDVALSGLVLCNPFDVDKIQNCFRDLVGGEMNYCCHILAGSPRSLSFNLDRVQHFLCGLVCGWWNDALVFYLGWGYPIFTYRSL